VCEVKTIAVSIEKCYVDKNICKKEYCSTSEFNASKAVRAQLLLKRKINLERLDLEGTTYDIIAYIGLDASYAKYRDGSIGVGVAVAINAKNCQVIDYACYLSKICVPYIPGLLAFREAQLMIGAYLRLMHKLKNQSSRRLEILFVNGHGIAHPRGLGIASHIGVVLDKPAIGVAKRILTGNPAREIMYERGVKLQELVMNNRVTGFVLEDSYGKIIISPGHKISMHDIPAHVLKCKQGLLPVPIAVADSISKKLAKEIRNITSRGFIEELLCSNTIPVKNILDYISSA